MDGAGNELFAGAGLAQNQDGGGSGRDRLHLAQNALQHRVFADDRFEVVLGADLAFEITLLLGQLAVEHGDLAEGQRVVHGDRRLIGHLGQQIQVLPRESGFTLGSHAQHAEHAVAIHQRQPASGANALLQHLAGEGRGKAGQLAEEIVHQQRMARAVAVPRRRVRDGERGPLLDETFASGKVQRIDAQQVAAGRVQDERGIVVVDDLPQQPGDGDEELAKVAVRHQQIGDVEQQAQAVALPLQLPAMGESRVRRGCVRG